MKHQQIVVLGLLETKVLYPPTQHFKRILKENNAVISNPISNPIEIEVKLPRTKTFSKKILTNNTPFIPVYNIFFCIANSLKYRTCCRIKNSN